MAEMKCWKDFYLGGEKNRPRVGVDVCGDAFRGSCYHEDVCDAQEGNQHQQRLRGLAVLLRLHGVGRPQLRDQNLKHTHTGKKNYLRKEKSTQQRRIKGKIIYNV